MGGGLVYEVHQRHCVVSKDWISGCLFNFIMLVALEIFFETMKPTT